MFVLLNYRARHIWNVYYNPSDETTHISPKRMKKSTGFFDDAFPEKLQKAYVKDELEK
jgi:hypothetical protein